MTRSVGKTMAALLAAFCLCLPGIALAETEILLKDGSRIRGEVVSMSNGMYEIRTQSMGIIKLGSRQIQSISQAGSSGGSSAMDTARETAQNLQNKMTSSTMESIQSTIANSPGLMNSIMSLQNDPKMQAILQDPELMKAVHNMDFKTLSNHPKMKALMNSQEVRAITNQVK